MVDRRLEPFRREFPILRSFTFLNHAGISPLPRTAAEVMARCARDFSRKAGAAYFEGWGAAVERTRRLAARLLGARPSEVAFVGNTTSGVGLVAAGLDWRAGDNVVGARIEYPAVLYPFRALASRGVRLKLVDAPDGRPTPERLLDACDRRTRLIAASWVQFTNGYRLDPGALARAAHRRGVAVLIDAIQGLGAIPFAARRWGIDYAAAGGFKWLLGPLGSGLFFCRKDRVARLTPPVFGADSVRDLLDFLNLRRPLVPEARRFEGGSLNVPGIAALGASLELLLGVGPARAWRRIRALQDRLVEGLQRRAYVVTSSRVPSERSGILTFRSPRSSPEAIEAALRRRNVVTVVRAGGVRVAPHFYNDEGDIDRLLDALPR